MKLFKKEDPNYKLKMIVAIEGLILVGLIIATVTVAVIKFH